MDDKDRHILAKLIENDLEGLIYKEPKCDFEHIWNSAIDSAKQVCESYQEDEYIELNEEKLDEYVITDEDSDKSRETK
ncbi:hypothetical protein [Lutibacter sp.]|uniref:hypothetical protein n=1 Tax=Lutibacter sp. TaxID=1925666 RepID=UPI0034A0701E